MERRSTAHPQISTWHGLRRCLPCHPRAMPMPCRIHDCCQHVAREMMGLTLLVYKILLHYLFCTSVLLHLDKAHRFVYPILLSLAIPSPR